jgi:hypothetical protein
VQRHRREGVERKAWMLKIVHRPPLLRKRNDKKDDDTFEEQKEHVAVLTSQQMTISGPMLRFLKDAGLDPLQLFDAVFTSQQMQFQDPCCGSRNRQDTIRGS